MSELFTLPAGMRNLAGQTINGLTVTQIAGRNPFRWNVECQKCKSRGTELHTALANGAARCRLDACMLHRLSAPKISKYEEWLNSAEPEKQPVTAPVPVTPAPEHVSDEYRRYRRHAVINGWAQVISWQEWQEAGERGREWLLQQVNEEK